MNEPLIVIILINYKNVEDTIECLKSIQQLEYNNYKVIIVDNHSHDGSVEKLHELFPQYQLIASAENKGFAGGNNVAIAQAMDNKADFIFLLNNDTIVEKNILKELVQAAEKYPKAGIFGSKIFHYDNKEMIDHFGGHWHKEKAEFFSLTEPFATIKDKKVDYVSGCAFFIKRAVIERIGLLDENFFLIWEETDYCSRAIKQGFEIWAIHKAHLWHKISASFSGGKPHTYYYWWRNRLLWIEKNCPPAEKKWLYKHVIFPEVIHLIKLRYLKIIPTYLSQLLFWQNKKRDRMLKYLRYKAGVKGIYDFVFKRFGKGPIWISKMPKESFFKR